MRLRSVLLWSALLACLLGAAALTLLRVLGPERGVLVRAVSFAPAAVPAYLVGLVLLAVLARSHRRLALALLLVPACGLALHGWWLAPYLAGDAPTPAAGGARMRVMTVNVLNGTGEPEEVVQAAEQHDVDLLAVQEIEPSTLWAMEDAGLNERLPFHAGEAVYGVSGSMLFSRNPITDVRPIGTQWVSFTAVTEVDGEPVTVVVTHPESPMGDGSGWRSDHEALRGAVREERPDLVLGDLNATVDHGRFRRLLATGLRDAAEVANSGWQPTWPSAGQVRVAGLGLPRLLAIDHVLLGRRWTATGTRVVEIAGTDHAALVAEVALR
ncbi:endonuclease/exonuclease/phosphatase family protein [Nocardioides sp. 616]|uniref:endonuclease/exonuclease/phosphatase family protein n=1 Tax=Nocardioides sp. 616 TaxID=2268090 RepID=UPI000CE4532C|nr:endonuclease/exonuclease/phosphatase family protein [Nocardioides sp. 616]